MNAYKYDEMEVDMSMGVNSYITAVVAWNEDINTPIVSC